MIPSLGSKGQGWVALQGVLLVAILVVGLLDRGGWPDAVRTALLVLGIALMIAGVAVFTAAIVGLGSALTANPAPLRGASLRSGGVYGVVRHPIYSGLILASAGFALATGPWALVPVALLAVELDLKRRVEERWLLEAYPEYADYRRRVGAALVPGIW